MAKGLINCGNTCSINALLQCLAHSRLIRRFFRESVESGGTVTRELRDILRELTSDKADAIVTPQRFISALIERCRGILHYGEQHDVCEICTLLCDKVAEECFDKAALKKYTLSTDDIAYWKAINVQYAIILSKAVATMRRHNANNECEWLDMIQGVIVTQIQCTNSACEETYHNFEPFTVLSIEIPQDAKNLYDCLDAFFAPEKLDDWTCDKCKGKYATRMMRIWKLPRVFAISLKRFGADLRKNGRHIDIPYMFHMSPSSVIGPQYLHRKNNITYKLCSVALHHGNVGGGHYTAIGRGNNDEWLHYDDTNVYQVPHANVTESYMMLYELPR